MGKRLKLMADYGCFPLWNASPDEVGNVDPDELPLSDDLRSSLRKWAASYDGTLNQEYPPESGFASPADEAAFEAEGRRLWREVQSQLGTDYKVVYYSSQQGRVVEALPPEPNQAVRLSGGP